MNKFAKQHKIGLESANSLANDLVKKCVYFNNGLCGKYPRNCSVLYNDCEYNDKYINSVDEIVKISKAIRRQIKVQKKNNNKCINQVTKKIDENKIPKDNKDKIIAKNNDAINIGVKDFIIRTNVFRCMHNKHNIKNINAVLNIINHKGKAEQVTVTAGYCEECKIYFIMEPIYEHLKNKGMLLCRTTDEKNYKKFFHIGEMKLAQQSILMQYGYNVSQTEELTPLQRHKILAVLIDYAILSKSEIISYLNFFINQRSSMRNMEIAITKWQNDIDFVEMYKKGHYTQYGVGAIHIKS